MGMQVWNEAMVDGCEMLFLAVLTIQRMSIWYYS